MNTTGVWDSGLAGITSCWVIPPTTRNARQQMENRKTKDRMYAHYIIIECLPLLLTHSTLQCFCSHWCPDILAAS